MTYPSKPKGEDVNATERVHAPQVYTAQAPLPAQVTPAKGGAPRISSFGTEITEELRVAATRPWGGTDVTAPRHKTRIDNPNELWTLRDIQQQNPEVVEEMKAALWQRYQAASEEERNGPFFQGVRQNPELAAATMVRRAVHNMARANQWINGERTPTLDEAAQDTLRNNDLRKWLQWTRSGGRMPNG